MTERPRILHEFPCSFSLKAIGVGADDFEGIVIAIVRRHVPTLGEGAVTSRLSTGGKYLAVTATFIAESQEQLDAVYRELHAHERTVFLL
jgi:putative lipoic acid-binding regulatory protein